MHGGSSPQALAKAEERAIEAEAESAVRRLWVGLENATPVTDPVSALQRLAGALQEMTDQVGADISELRNLETGEDMSRVRGRVALFERLLGHLRGTLTDMKRLGIAEEGLRLEQDQARMLAFALVRAQDAVSMSPEDREVFARELMGGMRMTEGQVLAS